MRTCRDEVPSPKPLEKGETGGLGAQTPLPLAGEITVRGRLAAHFALGFWVGCPEVLQYPGRVSRAYSRRYDDAETLAYIEAQ
jgi:hypothetical protein